MSLTRTALWIGPAAARPAAFRDVFAVREFRALWLAVALSASGDRLALIALTVFAYERTRSPLLAASVYAAGYLPWLIGGLLLSGLADRRPRRTVMVTCDAVRAVLVAAMIVPRVPTGALVALLFAATVFAPPFESAKAAVTPDILATESYPLGAAVIQATYLAAEVAGAAGGGAAVAFLGTRPALGIDVATFVVSGLLIGLGTAARPVATVPRLAGPAARPARPAGGLRLIFGDRALRTLVLLGWLAALYTIPQAVAAPYVARLAAGPVLAGPLAVGLVLASTSLATAIGTPLFCRLVRPSRQGALIGPLAVASCAPLVLTAFRPGLVTSLLIFSVSAGSGAYQAAVTTAFACRVPDERRAQAFGIAGTGVVAVQGTVFVAAGAAAEVAAPAAVIAVAGAIGALAALMLARAWRRVSLPPG